MATHSMSLRDELRDNDKGKSRPKDTKPSDNKGSKKK